MMAIILVDSNMVLDIADETSSWHEWTSQTLEGLDDGNRFVINPVIYAEVSIGYKTIEEYEKFIRHCEFDIYDIPREALFLAGKAFSQYRRSQGGKRNVLPDFFIGAHAAVSNMKLATRDKGRFGTYFPTLELISPDRH